MYPKLLHTDNQSDATEKEKQLEQDFIDEKFEEVYKKVAAQIAEEKLDEEFQVYYAVYKLGFKEKFIEGFEQGKEIAKNETIKNGILAGLSNEIIKVMTNLTDEQIDKIRAELKSNDKTHKA